MNKHMTLVTIREEIELDWVEDKLTWSLMPNGDVHIIHRVHGDDRHELTTVYPAHSIYSIHEHAWKGEE